MKNDENINQLLAQFMTGHEAQNASRDIAQGDRLFRDHPAPRPSVQCIEHVRDQLRQHVKRSHQRSILRWGSAAASAAAILLAGLYVFTSMPPAANPPQEPVYLASATKHLWNQLSSSDSLLLVMDQELTDVAESIDAIESERIENPTIMRIDLLELEELEMIASNTDFWKG